MIKNNFLRRRYLIIESRILVTSKVEYILHYYFIFQPVRKTENWACGKYIGNPDERRCRKWISETEKEIKFTCKMNYWESTYYWTRDPQP